MARTSLWALPAAGDAAPFAGWIERLANEVGAPVFAPHITLLGEVPPRCMPALDRVLAAWPTFDVRLVALVDSENRFRCITVTAAPDPPLVELRAAAGTACGIAAAPFEPHLSLLYAELSEAERAVLRAGVTLPLPTTITVDAVSLVDTGDDDSTRWSVARTWRLSA